MSSIGGYKPCVDCSNDARGDLCKTCITKRRTDYCRGGCGKRLLKQYVFCTPCKTSNTERDTLNTGPRITRPRSARQRKELEAYAKQRGLSLDDLLSSIENE